MSLELSEEGFLCSSISIGVGCSKRRKKLHDAISDQHRVKRGRKIGKGRAGVAQRWTKRKFRYVNVGQRVDVFSIN